MSKTVIYLLLLWFGCTGMVAAASEDNATVPAMKVDTLTVAGAVLQGQVRGLTRDGLSFSLMYGQGSIKIPYGKIEQLRTEHYYHIFYDGHESDGRIVSINDHRWLVVEDRGRRELIDVNTIERFILSTREDDSFVNRIHNYFPFWSGNLDLGLEYEEGGTNKKKLNVAVRFEYNRLRQRIVLIGTRALEDQQPPDTNWTTTKDEYLFSFEDDYYLTLKQEEFVFISCGLERDAIREIDRRTYPAVGVGYKRSFSNNFWVNVQLGGGGVFSQYVTYGKEEYAALYLGSEMMYESAYGPLVRAKVLYMPSASPRTNAWLFRATASVTVPLTELFALKWAISDVDDDNPSPDIGNNKITTDLALSFTF